MATTVTGTWLRPNGDPCQGRVTFRLVAASYNTTLEAIFPVVPAAAVLDVAGGISIDVEPTSGDDNGFDADMTYQVTERIDGVHRLYYVDIPSTPAVDLGTLDTFDDPPSFTRQLVVPDLTDLGYATTTQLTQIVVNVRDFGAVGDGSTDDTVAIQAAIDSLLDEPNIFGGLGGGTVHFPVGVYKVSDTITVGAVGEYVSGFRLTGASIYSSVLEPTAAFAAKPVVKFINTRKSGIADMAVHGNATTSPQCGVQFHRDDPGGDAPPGISHNIVENTAIGRIFEGDTPNIVNGIRVTCAVGEDGNNDAMFIINPFISGCESTAINFEGKEAVQQNIFGGVINYSDIGVATKGGAFNATGLIMNEITDCEFDFQEPFSLEYRQASTITACNTEYDGALGATMIRTTDDEHIDIHVTGYTRMGSLADIDLIDYHSDGQLTFTNCNFFLGQADQRVNLTHADANVAVLGCTLAWTDINYNGDLKVFGNGYRTVPDYTDLGSGTLVDLDNAFGAWQDYDVTPAGTSVAVGDGTTFGRYFQSGKTIHFWAAWNLGTTSVMNSAGLLTLNLPVTGHNSSVMSSTSGRATEAGVGSYMMNTKLTTTAVEIYRVTSTNGVLAATSGTTPFTWGDGDSIVVSGTYEAA